MDKILIKKFFGIVILLIIASILYWNLKSDPQSENISGKSYNGQIKQSEFIRTTDKVTTEMLSADYWLKKQDTPSQVIMTALEISLWNNQFRNTDFWETVDNTMLTDENEIIHYGYTVNRASIRKEPTNELVPTEPDSNFFCELQVSSILMNEPVVVIKESEDGLWYYIKCSYCEGWIEAKYVAICDNYDHWIANMNPENFLLVTGNKEILDVDTEHKNVSEVVLYMGTKLELIKHENYLVLENARVPYECYIVKVPTRDEGGYLQHEYAFVPVSKDVNVGYLPYTMENLLTQMFKMNGDRYGWGGMYNARDCSQYIMEIYRLFGFEFARNSASQAQMPFEGWDLDGLNENEKEKILDKTPVGSILYFEGHVMLYLGEVEGEHYVISETARILPNNQTEEDAAINAHSCMITPLSVKRANGNTWLEDLSIIKCVQ